MSRGHISVADIEARGERRERARIRRELRSRFDGLDTLLGSYWVQAKRIIDAATKAPKRGRR